MGIAQVKDHSSKKAAEMKLLHKLSSYVDELFFHEVCAALSIITKRNF